MDGTASQGLSTRVSRQDHVHPTDTSRAPTSHASFETTYGVSSASNYGHAKASSTTPKINGTASTGSEVSTFARGDHVHPTDTSRAPLASPAFTGTPTAPTPSAFMNNTQIATTAFVKSQNYAQNRGTGTQSIALGAGAVAPRDYQIAIGTKFVCFFFASTETEANVYAALSPYVTPTTGISQGAMGSFGELEVTALSRASFTSIKLLVGGFSKEIRSGDTTQIGSNLAICTVMY